MSRDDDLSSAELFRNLPDGAIQALCAQGETRSFESGHILFERGQNADQLMIVQQGVIDLFFPIRILGATRELTLESKQAGDVVAWSTLVPPYRFTLSARCASACVLTALGREALQLHFAKDPGVGYVFMRNLAGVIGQRLQAMQTNWIHDLQVDATKHLEQ